MSQVRKFDKGGTAAQTEQQPSTEAKKKYRLIINGKEMLLDDDGLADFRKSGSGQNGMMGNVYADIADALQAGNTVQYNSDSNTISGVTFKRIDPEAIAKANENQVWDRKAQRRANRYARKNNLTHQFNEALASIGNINFYKPEDKTTDSSDSSSSKLTLFGSYNPFEYNIDDQGNKTFAQSPLNATAKRYIDAYADLVGLTRDQAKEKYNFDDEKYDQLMNWYNTYGQGYKWSDGEDSLWSRIQNGNYNENDDELLKLLGWDITKKSEQDSTNPNVPRSYEGSGINDDWLTKNNYYVRKHTDGNTYLYRLGTDENGKPKYLIDQSAKIYLPNMGILGDNSQWNGGAIINGRFYTENEIWDPNSAAGQSFAELTRAWNSGSGETSWQNAKNTGWQFAGSNADNYMFSTYDRNTGTNPLWDQYFNQYKDDDNIWYVRNLANNFSGTPKGMEIISYIDQNNRSRAGYENPYFAVYNPQDKKFRRFENEEALSSYLQGLNIQKQSSLYSGDANFDIHDFLFDKNKNKYSYVSPINTFTGTGSSQQSTELYRGPDGNYYYLLDNSNPEDLQFIRLDDQNVVNQILNGQTISNEDLPSWAKRRLLERGKRKYMKQGGKINFDKINYLQKHQYGGIFSNPYTGSTNKKERNKDAKITIGDAHQAFGGGKHGVRTKADKLANWATGFDTAAVGTSFVPVYGNIVGAVSGLTGSALRFASDIKKDGFQGKDLWKFLGNVGLDALTLIPGLGSAAAGVKAAKGASKVAKVASTIAKGAGKVAKWGDTTKLGKTVTYGLPAMGVLQGTDVAIQAATDGQPLTTDQLQTIAGGLIGGVILGNKAGKLVNNKALKSVQKELGLNKPKSYEYKGKDKTVSLSSDDINAISNKKAAKVNEFLYNKLQKEGIELEKPNFETATLWKDFGITANLSKRGPWGWWGNKVKIKSGKANSIENSILQNKDLAKKLSDPKSWKERRAQKAYSEQILQNPELATFVRSTTGAKVIPQGKWAFGGWGTKWILGKSDTPKQQVLMLPAWNPPTPSVSNNGPITAPYNPVANAMRNSQGQLLLPRGNGKFFSKVQKAPIFQYKPEVQNPLSVARLTGKDQSLRNAQRSLNLHSAQAKKQFEQSPERLVGNLLNGSIRTQDEVIDYILKNVPKNKQQQMLDLFFNKAEFKELLSKVASQSGFSSYAKAIESLPNWLKFKQGGKIIKALSGTKMPFGTFVQDNNLNDPNLYDYSKSGIQFNGSDVDWTKTYGTGLFTDLRNYYLDNWDIKGFEPVRMAYLSQLSTGNNNVDLTNFTKDDFIRLTSDKKLGFAHNLWTDQLRDYLYKTGDIFKISGMNINNNKDTFVPYLNLHGTPMTMQQTYDYLISKGVSDEQVEDYITRNAGKFANSYGVTKLDEAIVTASPSSTQANEEQPNGSKLGQTKQERGFNWDPDTFIGLGNLAYSINRNNRMYGVLDDAIRTAGSALQKQIPTEIYDRYQDHLTPIYQEAADAKRQFTPTSTDAILNYTMRQTNEDTAQQLLTEGRLKASEAYSQYLDKDLAARRAYADQRREVADQNRAIMANTVMQLGQNDAARRLANNQSVQNFVMEFRNKLSQDKAKRDNLLQSYYTTKAQNDYNTAFRNYLSNADGKNYYQLFKEATDKAPNETFEEWLYRTDMNAYNKANEAGIAAAGKTRWNGVASTLNWFGVPDYPGLVSTTSSNSHDVRLAKQKRGGKISTYIQRHNGPKPDEAIWIQRNKDTAKALEKLHDAVIKLFMKALS